MFITPVLAVASVAVLVLLFSKQTGVDTDRFVQEPGVIHCPSVPVSVIQSANSAAVSANVKLLRDQTRANKNAAEIALSATTTATATEQALGLAEFLVVSHQLCLDAASSLLTREEYKNLKTQILPKIQARLSGPEKRAGFDVAVKSVEAVEVAKGKHRAIVTVEYRPLSKNNDEFSTISYGLVSVHDELKAGPSTGSAVSEETCAATPSCLGSTNSVVTDQRPAFIRGGVEPHTAQVHVDLSSLPKRPKLRVFVEFYQREADNGGVCVRDASRSAPADGIPFLVVLNLDGSVRAGGTCYRAYSTRTFLS